MTPLNTPEWQSLERHYADLKYVSMRDEFALDASRFEHFSLTSGDLLLDYSKNRITKGTVRKLVALAESIYPAG